MSNFAAYREWAEAYSYLSTTMWGGEGISPVYIVSPGENITIRHTYGGNTALGTTGIGDGMEIFMNNPTTNGAEFATRDDIASYGFHQPSIVASWSRSRTANYETLQFSTSDAGLLIGWTGYRRSDTNNWTSIRFLVVSFRSIQ